MEWTWLCLTIGLAMAAISCCQSAPAPWLADGGARRVLVNVEAGEVDRFDVPVEAPLAIEDDTASFRVVEVSKAGDVLDANVSWQFDRTGRGKGLLTFIAKGLTKSGSRRYFHVYEAPAQGELPPALVSVTDDVPYQGQASVKIDAANATWIYHKTGAGFASLIDADGNDWISFRPTGGSDGKYRGIPNLVYPEGYFHPGGTECESTVVSAGPVKATIESTAEDGAWAVRWDIYPRFARLTVLRAPGPYWFLYEGTPGGTLDEAGDYCLRPGPIETPASEKWDQVLPRPKWVCFGDRTSRRAIFLFHHDGGEEIDSYWPMEQNMTVFGFGRQRLNKYLTQAPTRFTVGLADDQANPTTKAAMFSAATDLAVRVGPWQCRPSESER